jgi:hypothetical protein
MRAMGLRPGMTVADVGSGVWYMLPFLSRAVGVVGEVIAADMFDDYLAAAKIQAANRQLTDVTFVKGTDKDPSLHEAAADEVPVLDAYHHFDYPQENVSVHPQSAQTQWQTGHCGVLQGAGGDAQRRCCEPHAPQQTGCHQGDRGEPLPARFGREQIKDSQYMLILEKN